MTLPHKVTFALGAVVVLSLAGCGADHVDGSPARATAHASSTASAVATVKPATFVATMVKAMRAKRYDEFVQMSDKAANLTFHGAIVGKYPAYTLIQAVGQKDGTSVPVGSVTVDGVTYFQSMVEPKKVVRPTSMKPSAKPGLGDAATQLTRYVDGLQVVIPSGRCTVDGVSYRCYEGVLSPSGPAAKSARLIKPSVALSTPIQEMFFLNDDGTPHSVSLRIDGLQLGAVWSKWGEKVAMAPPQPSDFVDR